MTRGSRCPAVIAERYDRLWTEARMAKVSLAMQKALGLTWKDMFVPGHQPSRAQRE